MTNDFGASVSIVLGRGDGTFQMAAPVPVGPNPLSLAIGDFNGDGHQDLAVTNTNRIRFPSRVPYRFSRAGVMAPFKQCPSDGRCSAFVRGGRGFQW